MMNLGTLGPGITMKPFGFLVRSFLTARVTFLPAAGRDDELGDAFKEDDHHGELGEDACSF